MPGKRTHISQKKLERSARLPALPTRRPAFRARSQVSKSPSLHLLLSLLRAILRHARRRTPPTHSAILCAHDGAPRRRQLGGDPPGAGLGLEGLQRLLERDPAVAEQRGDHGMLPIHWACTVRRVPLSLVAKLLQAYPDGVRAKNAGELLPLHIAIRAGVQASCLRKIVRAYPEAVTEPTPDGVTALELAEESGLDADSLKVLHRAHERSSILQQQNDDDRSSVEAETANFDPKRELSGQEEGEASGVRRPEDDEEDKAWSDPVVPEPYVGNVGFIGLLHMGDDGDLDATGMSVLEAEDSFSMMSEQSLSDVDGLDSPHDHLVSPSSTSTCSQDDPRTPTSSRSSFDAHLRTASRRSLGGFQNQNQEEMSRQQQQTRLVRTASVLAQLQSDGVFTEHELRTMVSAMSANAAMSNAEEGASTRSHSRQMSLPVMPSYENLRQTSGSQFYDEADDEDENDENDNGSSRDSTSTAGGATSAQVNPRGRLFQSVQEPMQTRHSTIPGGSQRGSPPLFRRSHRRASHGGSHSRGHFDPPGVEARRRVLDLPRELRHVQAPPPLPQLR